MATAHAVPVAIFAVVPTAVALPAFGRVLAALQGARGGRMARRLATMCCRRFALRWGFTALPRWVESGRPVRKRYVFSAWLPAQPGARRQAGGRFRSRHHRKQ